MDNRARRERWAHYLETSMTPATRPAPGWGLTLYAGGGDPSGDSRGLVLVEAHKPPLVGLHCASVHLVAGAAAVRKVHPTARLWAGLGVDGIAKAIRAGTQTVAQGVATMRAAAGHAVDAGCEVAVWDPEGAQEAPAGTLHQGLETFARQSLAAVAADHPTLVQGFTSFDHPTVQGPFPWDAWLGTDSPVMVHLPQVYEGYARAPGGPLRTEAQLRGRLATSRASMATGVRLQGIRADLGTGAGVGIYLQAHDVDGHGTANVAREIVAGGGWCLLWPPAAAEGVIAVVDLASGP